MSRVLIGYRDYVQDAVLTSNTSFEAGTPLTNAQDRRLAVVARTGVYAGTLQLIATLDAEHEIGIIALLNHNLELSSVTVKLYSGVTLVETINGGIWAPPTFFTKSAYILPDSPVPGIDKVQVDFDFSGGVDAFELGRFWAGPVWTPEEVEGVSRDEFDPRIADDNSTINKSRGGQNYADVAARFRVHTMSLPYLTEADAIGTDDGLTQNLQDIAFEVGKTQPVIVIPSLASNQVIHKFGLYGTFEEPPSPRLIPESSERHYNTTFTVIEEL